MKKRLKQIQTLQQDAFSYLKLKFKKIDLVSNKNIYVNVSNPNLYHRFFYLLLKFYQLSGYQIIFPMDFKKFRNLRNGDYYLSLILKEENFLKIEKNLPEKYIEIQDENLSADYFKNYFKEKNQEKNAYHIPMSFHPLMYHKEIWNIPVNAEEKRINSVFCYGNFDEKAYTEIDSTSFKVINRVELLSLIKKTKYFHSILDKSDLERILDEKIKNKFFFAIKEHYQVPMREVRPLLSKFRFYLCCPGVVMPLCHNVVEAMSVGTIPIIQKEYAEVMYPNLENGKNAIIFENENNLNEIIENYLFEIPDEAVQMMSSNALQYYFDFLTPKKVIEKINLNLGKSIIYLNAEHRSVNLIKTL